jgi:hypothetical protein
MSSDCVDGVEVIRLFEGKRAGYILTQIYSDIGTIDMANVFCLCKMTSIERVAIIGDENVFTFEC